MKQLPAQIQAIRIASIINCLLDKETNTNKLLSVLSIDTKLEALSIIKIKLPEQFNSKLKREYNKLKTILH